MDQESTNAPFNLCSDCLPASGESPSITLYKDTDASHRCKLCTSYFTNYSNRKLGINGLKICPTCSKIKHLCQHCLLDIQLLIPMDLRDEIFAELGLDKDYKHLTDNMKNIKSEIMKRYIHDQNSKLLASDSPEKGTRSTNIDYANVVIPKIREKLDQTESLIQTDQNSDFPTKTVNKKDIQNFEHFKKVFSSVLDFSNSAKPASQISNTDQSANVCLLLFNISRQTAEWEILKSLNENYKIVNSQIVNFNCKQTGGVALLQCTASAQAAFRSASSSSEAFFTMNMGKNNSKIYFTFISLSQYAQINKFLSNALYQELNNLNKFINFSMIKILKAKSQNLSHSVDTDRSNGNIKAEQKKQKHNKVTKKGKRIRHNLDL